MCDIICVSNRHIFYNTFGKEASFSERICAILQLGIRVILREKDLTEKAYYDLLCDIGDRRITAHTFSKAAKKFGCENIHMPLDILENTDVSGFDHVGCSVHSSAQAAAAAKAGADYLTAGHIFVTDCKKGLAPRDTELIRDILSVTDLPVYGIGGITPENASEVIKAGGAGVCVMSGFMSCEDPVRYAERLERSMPK